MTVLWEAGHETMDATPPVTQPTTPPEPPALKTQPATCHACGGAADAPVLTTAAGQARLPARVLCETCHKKRVAIARQSAGPFFFMTFAGLGIGFGANLILGAFAVLAQSALGHFGYAFSPVDAIAYGDAAGLLTFLGAVAGVAFWERWSRHGDASFGRRLHAAVLDAFENAAGFVRAFRECDRCDVRLDLHDLDSQGKRYCPVEVCTSCQQPHVRADVPNDVPTAPPPARPSKDALEGPA